MRSFLEYTGPQRSHRATRPNFPTNALAAFADHEDPKARPLAARDPETEPTTAGRLTQDPEYAVRAAAARHPNLPQSQLAALLDDQELALHAATNAALNVDTIHRLMTTDGHGGKGRRTQQGPIPPASRNETLRPSRYSAERASSATAARSSDRRSWRTSALLGPGTPLFVR